MKQEFMVNEVRVQLFMDVDGIEVHVMGKTQGVNEDGMYWFSVRLNGEVEEYVSPLTTDNEAEFFVYGAIASEVMGYSYYALLAAQGYSILGAPEFARLCAGIKEAENEVLDMGIVLPPEPSCCREMTLQQLFALSPVLGAPDVRYNMEGTVVRIDYGEYGYAVLDEDDGVSWYEGAISVTYFWQRKE